MPDKARRLLSRLWRPSARRALLMLCLWLAGAGSALACQSMQQVFKGAVPDSTVGIPSNPAQTATGEVIAFYADLSDRYGHAVLGDAMEPITLGVWTPENSASCGIRLTLDPPHVFEDTAPRLVDLTGDGLSEIITVRSHERFGAQLAVYKLSQDHYSLTLLTATPYIGTRNRWLAPVGAADLDGDGAIEIAYVDRPHLAKTLRIWKFENNALTEVATFPAVTNHRIGETDIAGGIRTCKGAPEMIVAAADWSEMLALRFDGSVVEENVISADTSRVAFARALACVD